MLVQSNSGDETEMEYCTFRRTASVLSLFCNSWKMFVEFGGVCNACMVRVVNLLQDMSEAQNYFVLLSIQFLPYREPCAASCAKTWNTVCDAFEGQILGEPGPMGDSVSGLKQEVWVSKRLETQSSKPDFLHLEPFQLIC